MGRCRGSLATRSRAAAPDGTGGPTACRARLQRRHRGGPLAQRAGRSGAGRPAEEDGMIDVIELTAGGLRWRVAPQHREVLLNGDGLRLDEWLKNGQARVIKHASHRTVYQVHLPGLSFFLKHN